MYIAARGDGAAYIAKMAEELMHPGPPKNCDVLVFIDQGGSADVGPHPAWQGSCLFRVIPCGLEPRLHRVGSFAAPNSTNPGSADTLEEFVRYGLTTFPARKHALVTMGHGQGWTGVLGDIDLLTPREVSTALDRTQRRQTPLDLVVLVSCTNSCFETVSLLAPYSRHVIASEFETTPNAIGPNSVMCQLRSSPRIDGESLAREMLASYRFGPRREVSSCASSPAGTTQSLQPCLGATGVLTVAWPAVEGALERLAKSSRAWVEGSTDGKAASALRRAFARCAGPSGSFGAKACTLLGDTSTEPCPLGSPRVGKCAMRDLGTFASELHDVEDTQTSAAAVALSAALSHATMERVYSHMGVGSSAATGISIYSPCNPSGRSLSDYPPIETEALLEWERMLEAVWEGSPCGWPTDVTIQGGSPAVMEEGSGVRVSCSVSHGAGSVRAVRLDVFGGNASPETARPLLTIEQLPTKDDQAPKSFGISWDGTLLACGPSKSPLVTPAILGLPSDDGLVPIEVLAGLGSGPAGSDQEPSLAWFRGHASPPFDIAQLETFSIPEGGVPGFPLPVSALTADELVAPVKDDSGLKLSEGQNAWNTVPFRRGRPSLVVRRVPVSGARDPAKFGFVLSLIDELGVHSRTSVLRLPR